MRLRRIVSAVSLAAVATAGIALSPAPEDVDVPQPRVTVAVLDSGINPYHEWFNAGGTNYRNAAPSAVDQAVLDEFGIDEDHILDLTRTGSFAKDFATDAGQWADVNEGELYWFRGTNVMAISFDPGSRIILPDNNDDTHGTGTAGAVIEANPEAIVIFVEGTNDDAERWAFAEPGVDLVSTSYGPIGSLPVFGNLTSSYEGVVTNGKMHVGAADNTPALSPVDSTSGPWWTLGVAGYSEDEGDRREHVSGTLPDVVGDFTRELPYCADCEFGTRAVSGTSFATPRTAGTLSKILLEARRSVGHLGGIVLGGDEPLMVTGDSLSLSVWDLRRAIEEAAYVPTSGSGPIDTTPINPVAPYLQIGWGAVTPHPDAGVIPAALGHLGVDGYEVTRTKDIATCAFMTANIHARAAYWFHHPMSDGMFAPMQGYQAC